MVEQIHSAVDLLLGHPPTAFQKYALLVLGLVVVYLVFERMSRGLDARNSDPAKAMFLVAVGGAVIVLSMVATKLYVLPHVNPLFRHAVLFLSPVAGSLVVTIPAVCLLQKANFLSATISWFISVLITGMLLLVVRVGLEAVTTGQVSLMHTKNHKQEIEQFLKDQ